MVRILQSHFHGHSFNVNNQHKTHGKTPWNAGPARVCPHSHAVAAPIAPFARCPAASPEALWWAIGSAEISSALVF